jgi:hypothetical protein
MSKEKWLTVETLEGKQVGRATFDELFAALMPGYAEEDAATQWHTRREWATVMARRMHVERGVDIESLDWTSARSLVETAVDRGVLVRCDGAAEIAPMPRT